MKKGSPAAGLILADLASAAQAVDSWFHAAHLAASGTGFAGDHAILYADVYAKAGDAFDSLMERAIGIGRSSDVADPVTTLDDAAKFVRAMPRVAGQAPEVLASSAVSVCSGFIAEVRAATDSLRASDALTQGTDNLLAQIADDFEGFLYKLQQRAAGPVQKGADVDALIAKVMAGGLDKSAAIAVLKSNGTIKQDGPHLVMARRKKAKKPRPVKEMWV